MKKLAALLFSCSLLSGCTVQVVDKRISREEIATAFAQRDAATLKLAEALEAMRKAIIEATTPAETGKVK